MSTPLGAFVSLVVLAAAGVLPALCLVGRRWTLLPLSVLGGTVVSALAATCDVAVGGSLMTWYVVIAAVLAAGVTAVRAVLPSPRPADGSRRSDTRERLTRLGGLIALVGTGVWCLRGLRNPMVGLDARLFWVLRAGWWLMPHGQALTNMQRLGADTHAGYPPLVSSTVAVSWWVSGQPSERLGAVVIAIVNVLAALVAVWALVEFGARLRWGAVRQPGLPGQDDRPNPLWADLPLWTGIAVAVLLLFVFFGVTEPFTTNGYADPLWSVATAGAIGFLLLVPSSLSSWGTAGILLAVAGETKTEGTAIVIAIIVLLSLRSLLRKRERLGAALRRTVLLGVPAVLLLAAWPAVMRWRGVGADVNTTGPRQAPLLRRAQTVYDAMAPHLDILVVAAALSLIGAYALARRRGVVGSYLWAWVVVLVGIAIITGAYVFGPGNLFYLDLWLETSVHRVTDFPALSGWWIVASTVVLASSVVAVWVGQRRGEGQRHAPLTAGSSMPVPMASNHRACGPMTED